jgi:homoserine kinase type II
MRRANSLSLSGWAPLFEGARARADKITPGLETFVAGELAYLQACWPKDLPEGVIHADLFPDNVFFLGAKLSGLIDFYFACTEVRAYDLAVMHGAWAFDATGAQYDDAVGRALIEGYAANFALLPEERAALPVLAEGAAIRFLLTRAWDWLNTPADALVTRKDPLAYLRRLDFYAEQGATIFA